MGYFPRATLPLPLPAGTGPGNTPATPWDVVHVAIGGSHPWDVTVQWAIHGGRSEPADIRLHSAGGYIPAAAHRVMPVILRHMRALQAEALRLHAHVIASHGDSTTAAPFAEAARATLKPRPGPGRRPDTTPARLQAAADAWRSAPPRGRTAAVAAATWTGPSGAAKLVGRARKAGLLDK